MDKSVNTGGNKSYRHIAKNNYSINGRLSQQQGMNGANAITA